MQCSVVMFLALCCTLVPRIPAAPQRSIDFLLGDEELQAVVKPIEGVADSSATQDLEEEQLQVEVQATVDPIENEQRTEDPTDAKTDDYPEEEQITENPQEDPQEDPKEDPKEDSLEKSLAPVTDGPKDSEQNTTTSDLSTPSPVEPSSPAPPVDGTTPSPKNPLPSTTDSDEITSSEEQLTTNPIVVQENEEQTTTESNEDSYQLAQDVNDFINDLVNEVRTGASDKPRKPTPSTDLPVMMSDDSKSLESNEDDDQVQLKVDPNNEQSTNGPSVSVEQYRLLLEKLPWFGQRFPGFDQWQHQGFPQRSSWQPHRDDRQRHYQSHGSDGFQGHGFHRGSWH